MSKVVIIYSGGLDSTVLATLAKKDGHEVRLVGFDYGQRHNQELRAGQRIAEEILQLPYRLVDIGPIGMLMKGSGSSQIDRTVTVPEGHYAAESMKATIVPNRNSIMISIAVAYAISKEYEEVWFGAHTGDHQIYPDCRKEFVDALSQAILIGNEWTPVQLKAPFIEMSKADIVKMGSEVNAPMQWSWSCYNKGEVHCGLCSTCIERRESFKLAKIPDLTTYQVSLEASFEKGGITF